MSTLAIIPARGGSKRIPRKNIRPFLGKPIIAYSIETAWQSQLFDTVMVSTEDAEIAAVAKTFGGEVPFLRTEMNADDFATTADVLLEVLQQYEKTGQTFEYVCCIYPTAPFIREDILAKAWELLKKEKFTSVFPVTAFDFPIQRALKVNTSGKIQLFQPEHRSTRSQDLEPAYRDAGQFYWLDVPRFMEEQQVWTDNSGVVILSEMEAHDIDTEQDWQIAEFKYQYQQEQGAS